MISKPMLDLLIIDIDNTFISPRTVGEGCGFFLKNLSRAYGEDFDNEQYYTTGKVWFNGFKIITKGFLHLKPNRVVISKVAKLAVAGFHLNLLYFKEILNIDELYSYKFFYNKKGL